MAQDPNNFFQHVERAQAQDVVPQPPDILTEAKHIVYGRGEKEYGHPIDDFNRVAAMWSAILGTAVTAEQIGLCMIAVKLSRQCNKAKRDNLVDIAGYAETVHRVLMEEQRRSGLLPAISAAPAQG